MISGIQAAASLLILVFGLPAVAAEISLNTRLDLLVRSYPDTLSHHTEGMLYFHGGGEPMRIDDGLIKTHPEALANADIDDMLDQIYPLGPCAFEPPHNFDPGRIRSGKLMKRLYGGNRASVSNRLKRLDWFGRNVRVTSVHGVDKALARVRDDLSKLPVRHIKPARKSSGTFNWRKIAGTNRLSVHSFAAAIDINNKYADYWRWAGGKPGNVPKYKNRIPLEIVAIFEKHGFIWGGRWYHFDTMHFEYRPEMIAIARAANASACD